MPLESAGIRPRLARNWRAFWEAPEGPIGRARVTFPNGETRDVTLYDEQPVRGSHLVAQGVEEGKWFVVEVRLSDEPDQYVYDIRVDTTRAT